MNVDLSNLTKSDFKLNQGKNRFWHFKGVYNDPEITNPNNHKHIFTDVSGNNRAKIGTYTLEKLKKSIDRCFDFGHDVKCDITFEQNGKKYRIVKVSKVGHNIKKLDKDFNFVVESLISGNVYTYNIGEKILCVSPNKSRGYRKKRVTVNASEKIKITTGVNKENSSFSSTDSTSVLEYKKSEKSYLEERYEAAIMKLKECDSRLSALEDEIKKLQEEKSHLEYLKKHFEQ